MVWIDWAHAFLEHDLCGVPVDVAAALVALAEPDEVPASFRAAAAIEPKTDCGRWLAAGEEFIALVDADWWRVADWYRGETDARC